MEKSYQKMEESDLKLNDSKFEATSFQSPSTRRQYIRKQLSEQFAKSIECKLKAPVFNDEKNLQGYKITPMSESFGSMEKSSFWDGCAHPVRGFRRSSEFTKPDSEYLGTSQRLFN